MHHHIPNSTFKSSYITMVFKTKGEKLFFSSSCLCFSVVPLTWNKHQFFSSDQPVLSVPCTSGQAWYLSRSWDSFVHESTRDTGLPHSPDPRLYVKVKGAPLKGQGTGPPAGSARNMEYKLASPVICQHIWSRLSLTSHNAAMSDTLSNQQLKSLSTTGNIQIYVNQQKKSISVIMGINQVKVLHEYSVKKK